MMDRDPDVLSDTGTNCNLAASCDTNLSENNQARLESLEKKAVHLRLVLEKDFKAADIKWSMFVSAAFSFRYESCLRPFPPAFMKNGIKDMDELLSVITDVPALDLVLQHLDNLENLSAYSDIIDLLFYVLVRLKEPCLKALPLETHDAILSCVRCSQATPKPQYIFQVASSYKSHSEMKWKELAKNHHVFYAYHGNRLENFYTILNFGLQQHLNKNTMVGNGVYLSSELAVSLPYSHGGFGWGASCIGGHLSCVALCEVIDAPDGINYHRPIVPNEGFSGDSAHEDDKKKVKAEEHLPTSHYIVTNCDLIKVYTKSSSLTPVEVFFGVPYAAYDSSSPGANRFAGGVVHYLRTECRHGALNSRIAKMIISVKTAFFSTYGHHGESWLRGGVTLPCQELAAEGVVVVTVAYRLHALAFFTLGSIAARGNLALLDQYLALLWVRENIAAFGGDPATITLLGHSAGADSVLHHIASPRALDGQYDELLKRGAAYVTEYADTEIIPKLLRMFSLDQSEAVNMLAQAVHWEYWGANSRKDDRSVMKAVEAAGRAESAATWGAGGALLAARLARRVSRLYVYRYSQPAGTDVHGRLINYTGNFYAND
ncbi:hypothetical protein MSG28_010971 [Choristoneura fumiferana]|uniref:Uncharacterized protein n=1 Tax=Choristoneura fumiferana TaxID=7141 RepID=A0ACC0KQB8_CHOFU|nr:hypothetical protein MSG28_010971 [Choristoneura fumiferana]